MRELTEEQMETRRRAGADARDEMWDGVLHVAPDAGSRHQRLIWELILWLGTHWAGREGRSGRPGGNVAPAGVGDWSRDYRVPDLSLWTPQSQHVDRGAWFEGAPEVCVEIRSPDDESYAKIGTYLDWGAREVWIIDRDSCAAEIFVRGDVEPVERRGDSADGWVTSAFGIRMRGRDGRLEIELVDDPATRACLS